MVSVRRLVVGLSMLLVALVPAAPTFAQSAPPCQFVLGFKALHDLDPADVGDCVDNQAYAANGDAQQHTTKGLMAWRKLDNWTAFTNGYRTWINGPFGLAKRLNTQRFGWELNPDGLPVVNADGTMQVSVVSTTLTAGMMPIPDVIGTHVVWSDAQSNYRTNVDAAFASVFLPPGQYPMRMAASDSAYLFVFTTTTNTGTGASAAPPIGALAISDGQGNTYLADMVLTDEARAYFKYWGPSATLRPGQSGHDTVAFVLPKVIPAISVVSKGSGPATTAAPAPAAGPATATAPASSACVATVRASVKYPRLGGGTQTLYVTADDANGNPVAGATGDAYVQYSTTNRELALPTTDGSGDAAVAWSVGGPKGTVGITVTERAGGCSATGSTSFQGR